jgi:hypothetical protein
MMANPILAIVGLIAMGAIYIWQNWETLGPKFKAPPGLRRQLLL